MDSAIRAVGDLCIGEAGKVFNSEKSYDIAHLFDRNVVFELDALSEDAKTFFIEILLQWIHQYRLGEPEREVLKHVILIEEAHHLLLKNRWEEGKESISDVLFREIRELGESLILLDQHPSLVSKPVLGNTGTTLLMTLKHADDIRAAGDAIVLEPSQREHLAQLPVGWTIAKVPSWPKPFLVKIPHMPVQKGSVSDEAVSARMKGYLGDKGVIPHIPRQGKREERRPEVLSEDEKRLFVDGP